MSQTIVLIHGAWVTPASWDRFAGRLRAAGHVVHTPSWPLIEGLDAAAINASVPQGFGALGVGRIVDHLATFVASLPEPPILVGHSVGGLLTQLLLDRGLGVAAAVLNPVPIGGIVPGPRALQAIAPIVLRPRGWARPYAFSRRRFAALYATGAPEALIDEAMARYVIPAPGKVFHQAALWLGTRIGPRRRTQPLLITGSDRDLLVTPYLSRAAYRIQRRAPAPTEFAMLPGQSHLLIAEPGWERVVDLVLGWIDGLRLATPGAVPAGIAA
ncbi:alpha/beta fold hydrolase [Sphingomonas sp.]|uniref:alpha/beta hydrolase n=1 Tax=Sphingomonas sp. TaxID=28214 RepID=UPI001B154C14|nr:alpha/beta fold hydrolase [Sphingomonas sp.]MBO9714268.1 alpha/beta fold hydrolase [Sphingomonas sp.]